MAFVAGSSFGGAALRSERAVCSAPKTVVKMSADNGVSRRDLLLGALAAMVPASALAKGGDSPKYSFFGGGASSSPFTYLDKQVGSPLYKALTEEEVGFLASKLVENRERLANTDTMIAFPSWDAVRGEIRLQMYDTRRNILKITDALADEKQGEKAKKIYLQFKKDIEELDLACVQKDQTKAKKYRALALKDLDAWGTAVGFSF